MDDLRDEVARLHGKVLALESALGILLEHGSLEPDRLTTAMQAVIDKLGSRGIAIDAFRETVIGLARGTPGAER